MNTERDWYENEKRKFDNGVHILIGLWIAMMAVSPYIIDEPVLKWPLALLVIFSFLKLDYCSTVLGELFESIRTKIK